MVYLGGLQEESCEYEELVIQTLPLVLKIYNGIGLLNKYFRQVLNRVKK
jgi:hypothetical protein